jgi:uncharacterized protein (TIGR00369 family)
MDFATHYRRLESMYQAAPVNQFYLPNMRVEEGKATITMDAAAHHHHSAGAVHGSVYFKMLDDAAFFAANSYEAEVFVVTTSFTTYLTRPVSAGQLRAVGSVVNQNKQQFIAEAVLYDSDDRELGRGNGIFVRSKNLLHDAKGYADKNA